MYSQPGSVGLAAGIVGLEWGGNWTGFVDRPHFQLATGFFLTQVREKFDTGQPYF
jgi:peptidoglycan LD-endopeptidase CwlK